MGEGVGEDGLGGFRLKGVFFTRRVVFRGGTGVDPFQGCLVYELRRVFCAEDNGEVSCVLGFSPHLRCDAHVHSVLFRVGGGNDRSVRCAACGGCVFRFLVQRVLVGRRRVVSRVRGDLSQVLFFRHDPSCVVCRALQGASGLFSPATRAPTRICFFRINGGVAVRASGFAVVDRPSGGDDSHGPRRLHCHVVLSTVLLGGVGGASSTGEVSVPISGSPQHSNVFGVFLVVPAWWFELTNGYSKVNIRVVRREFRPVQDGLRVAVRWGCVFYVGLLRDPIVSFNGAVVLVRLGRASCEGFEAGRFGQPVEKHVVDRACFGPLSC